MNPKKVNRSKYTRHTFDEGKLIMSAGTNFVLIDDNAEDRIIVFCGEMRRGILQNLKHFLIVGILKQTIFSIMFDSCRYRQY